VAIVRDGDRNIVTMGSDFKGDAKEFAMVVPVPAKLACRYATEKRLI